jgi:acetyl esterase
MTQDLRSAARLKAGQLLVESIYKGLAGTARRTPAARPHLHGLDRLEDIAYTSTGSPDHVLDVWRPKNAVGSLPVVLYIHGGSFRILSKDSHWIMAVAFARAGYVVASINYRLSPKHRYPAAIEDACAAYRFVVDHITAYGGDPERMVVAGESAGGNLALGVTLAACYEREEPWARAVFDTGVVPTATIPFCAILQVSDARRFSRNRTRPLSPWVQDRFDEVADSYLGGLVDHQPGHHDLADPLVFLERGERPHRPLPRMFAPVGTGDLLVQDTRRLKVALDALGVPCTPAYYPREPHAFQAFVWRPQARQCWRDTISWLKERQV